MFVPFLGWHYKALRPAFIYLFQTSRPALELSIETFMWNLLCPNRRNKRVDMLSPYKWHKLLISPVIGTGIPRSVRWHFFEPNKMSANPNSTITTGRLVALRIQAIKVEIKDMTSTTREVAFRFQKEVTTSGRISTFTSDIFSRNLTGQSELGY